MPVISQPWIPIVAATIFAGLAIGRPAVAQQSPGSGSLVVDLAEPPISPRVTLPPSDEGNVVVTPLTEEDLLRMHVANSALNDTTSMAELNAEAEILDAPPKPPAQSPAAKAYKPLFYDNDFRYLNTPGDYPTFLGDYAKQLQLGDCWTIDLGGEYRLRHHNEAHLRFSDLSGRSDNFLLERTRLYTSIDYANRLRFYGEAIDATSNWQDFVPRGIEVNRFDALNLFVEGFVTGIGEGELWLRGGRQELLYGEQRLISPLDWANTRRTFDGLKTYYRDSDLQVDAFWTRPVPFAQHPPHDHNFDRSPSTQEFYGAYSTYKGIQNHIIDAYYLGLGDYAATTSVTQTIGGRWRGKHEQWLAEIEGGYQFGDFGPLNRSAGFYVLGGGREMVDVPWKPTMWVYYDWASGDRDPTDGQRNTFNQLFPLGHKYFGFCDLVARQNIRDLNFQVTAKPSQKVTLLAWWHIFQLDQARDALYNANGNAIRFDPSGAAGTNVGQELDLLVTVAINARTELLLGYSHFYAGSFVQATNPAGVSGDVDFTYTQLQWRF